jgi:hypothetical protein
LAAADVAGINFKSNQKPHFSGNFWWATAEYLRELSHPVVAALTHSANIASDDKTLNRLSYEMWVGINKP